MNRFIILIILIQNFGGSGVFAQKVNCTIALGDMGATMYPFQQVSNNTFSPYLKLSGEYNYVQKSKSTFFQALDFNTMYHGTIGFISGLGTAGGYRYNLTSKLSMDITLGVGISFIFPQSKQFKRNPDGNYSEKRPIFIKTELFSSLSFAYKLINEHYIFLRYGYSVLTNYNQSIDFLPYESTSIGYRFNLKP